MFENISGIVKSGFMFFFDVALYVLIGLFFVGVLAVFLYFNKYNKRVIIRKRINGKNKIFYDKARRVDKEGVLWWRLMRGKKLIPIPPDKAIEVDKKGKDFCEFYLLESGEYIPLLDKNDSINEVQPFTSNQRQLLQGQFTKANLERGFKFTDYLSTLTYIAALVIIVISLLVFYGDIAKPVLEMGDKVVSMQNKQIEFQKEMNLMINNLNNLQKGVIDSTLDARTPRNLTRGVPN